MTLFEECLEALGKDAKVLTEDDTTKIFAQLESCFPMVYIAESIWSRVDWSKISNKYTIDADINKTIEILKSNNLNIDNNVFILWNEATLPVVETKLNKILENIDDVIAVGFDTWIYCPYSNYLIEFYHENEITLGVCN